MAHVRGATTARAHLTALDATAVGLAALGLSAVGVVVVSDVAHAATLHVDSHAESEGDGGAASPYASLQQAVDAAVTGDTIKVAAGSYAPIVVSHKTITLLGGFDAAFAARDRDAHLTRIAAAGSGEVVVLDVAGDTVIEGFYISGGERGIRSDGSPYEGQNPRIRGNVIEDNVGGPDADGGGVWCKTNLVLEDNVIRNNHAVRGAGVFCVSAVVEVKNNLVEANIGHGDHGGGLFLRGSQIVISGNVVRGNVTGADGEYGVGGGIIVVGPGVAKLSGNVVTGNMAPKRGSGIFIDDEADATLSHDIVYANGCGYAGGSAIAVDGYDEARPSRARLDHVTVAAHDCTGPGEGLQVENAHVEVQSSIFWGNGDDFLELGESTLTVRYSLAHETVAGAGMLSADPRFADPAVGDFHLMSSVGRFVGGRWVVDDVDSPAIDAADPAAPFEREPEPNGGRADLGAFGNTAEASKSVGGPRLEVGIASPATRDQGSAPAAEASDGDGCACQSAPATRPRWALLALAVLVAFCWLRRRAGAAAAVAASR